MPASFTRASNSFIRVRLSVCRCLEANAAVSFEAASPTQEFDVRALLRAVVKDSTSYTAPRGNAASTVWQRTVRATAIRFTGKGQEKYQEGNAMGRATACSTRLKLELRQGWECRGSSLLIHWKWLAHSSSQQCGPGRRATVAIAHFPEAKPAASPCGEVRQPRDCDSGDLSRETSIVYGGFPDKRMTSRASTDTMRGVQICIRGMS